MKLLNIERPFNVWHFSASHSVLILRSNRIINETTLDYDDDEYNIDIEFVEVEYIDLPLRLNKIRIRPLELDESIAKFTNYLGIVFEIFDEFSYYYVVAAQVIIGSNKWFDTDRAQQPLLQYDNIIFTFK